MFVAKFFVLDYASTFRNSTCSNNNATVYLQLARRVAKVFIIE